MTPATFVLWIADRDGLAHARKKSRSTRTLCGIVTIDQRWSWPPEARCEACKEIHSAKPDR